jgi:hypothetical protein
MRRQELRQLRTASTAPNPQPSYLFCQSALTDLRNFADEVLKIPQVRLAVFSEALREFSRFWWHRSC